MKFDKAKFIKNVKYICRMKNLKIGELESSVGVSPGYISRLDKENNSSIPGVDTICSFAEKLNISIDRILSADISELSETINYILSFLSKLTNDTYENKIKWSKLGKEKLLNGNILNPLMRADVNANGFDYQVSYIYNSKFTKGDCELLDDFYCTKIGQNTKILLSHVALNNNEFPATRYELYIFDIDMTLNICASTIDFNELIHNSLEELHQTIFKKLKEPCIDGNVKAKIDLYMNN